MEFINKILERADIRKLCLYLLNGSDEQIDDDLPDSELLESVRKELTQKIHDKVKDAYEYDIVLESLFDYEERVKNIYMEIGLKCGVKLATQVISSNPIEFRQK